MDCTLCSELKTANFVQWGIMKTNSTNGQLTAKNNKNHNKNNDNNNKIGKPVAHCVSIWKMKIKRRVGDF